MSDVFYLNVPRTITSSGSSGSGGRPFAYSPNADIEIAIASPSPSPSPVPAPAAPLHPRGVWSVLGAVGLFSVGCALCIAARLWVLSRRRRRGKGPQPRPRRVHCHVGPAGNAHPPPLKGLQLAAVKEKEEMQESEECSSSGRSVFKTSDGRRYRRVALLGRGGFGTVYKCMSLDTGQLVAVKQIRLAEGDTAAAEVRHEFELLSRVEHPNIVRLLGYHLGQKHARLLLEWAAGGSLCDVLRQNVDMSTGMPEKLVCSYTRQMLAALECLHEHGIVHRDVKPPNMLIDHAGVLRMTDFGLSRLLATDVSNAQTGVAGTPRYMAPETLGGKYSFASDIWSVGATVSEMLTGRLPWSHVNAGSLPALLCYISSHPEDHPEIPPNLSAEGKDFLERCFRRNPIERGTAGSLLQHPFLHQKEGHKKKEGKRG